MVSQAERQKPFLEKVVERSQLDNINDAQRASQIVFRIMRDMMGNKTSNKIEADLKEESTNSEQKAIELWKDPNVMVAFFSRLSPAQDLHIKPGTFMLRLKQEGALPTGVDPENVTAAVFSATKEILPAERNQEVAKILPDELRAIWEQA